MNMKPANALTVEVGEANFESEILKSRQPVLAAFAAPWSRPCHILDSVLDEVATECAGNVKVVKINADENPDLSLLYGIQSIPTLLYFLEGNLRAKVVGTASKEAILAKLQTICEGGSASPNHEADKNEQRSV